MHSGITQADLLLNATTYCLVVVSGSLIAGYTYANAAVHSLQEHTSNIPAQIFIAAKHHPHIYFLWNE